jgi:hypothetical protein
MRPTVCIMLSLLHLAAFVEQAPWMWTACWLQEQELMEMMSGGGSTGLSAVSLESPAIPEDDAAEQIDSLVHILGQLETIWLSDPDMRQEIDVEDWQNFMDAIYGDLVDKCRAIGLIE